MNKYAESNRGGGNTGFCCTLFYIMDNFSFNHGFVSFHATNYAFAAPQLAIMHCTIDIA